jgi:hypothetical protein
MPNAIKYNVSAETLALKKGNFWIATGDVGKGAGTLTYSLETSSAKLYINGVLVNSTRITGTSQPTPQILYIYSRGGGGIFQKGNLYNILAYNTALSSAQVLQNYNALKGRYGLS